MRKAANEILVEVNKNPASLLCNHRRVVPGFFQLSLDTLLTVVRGIGLLLVPYTRSLTWSKTPDNGQEYRV